MSSDDNYFLARDYIANTRNETVCPDAGVNYWSPRMIHMANFYQYHVYLRAKRLIVEKGLRSVLDIGCGPALKLARLIAPVCKDIVAMDHPDVISFCKQRFAFAQFIAYDIEKDVFPISRAFDLVICADVIEHLVEPDKLLDDICLASTSDTIIIISTPERNILRGKNCLHSPNPVHVREWNFAEFDAYLLSRRLAVLEHKLVKALKFNWRKEYFYEALRQTFHCRPLSYCQMAICKNLRLTKALA